MNVFKKKSSRLMANARMTILAWMKKLLGRAQGRHAIKNANIFVHSFSYAVLPLECRFSVFVLLSKRCLCLKAASVVWERRQPWQRPSFCPKTLTNHETTLFWTLMAPQRCRQSFVWMTFWLDSSGPIFYRRLQDYLVISFKRILGLYA